MELDYTESAGNLYFKCRKTAAVYNEMVKSRDGAAELLGLSTSTLANYELGVTKTVPPDAVVMMADLYNAPELKAHYCANECPIGQGTPIATHVNSIELVTLKMIKAFSMEKAEDVKEKLIDIASDGKITEDELPTLEGILKYLDNMARIVSEIRLTCQKVLQTNCVTAGEKWCQCKR